MARAHHIDFVARRVNFEVLVLDVGHHRKIDQNLDVFARQNRAVELEKVFLLVPAHYAMAAAQVCEQAASEIALMSDEEDVHLHPASVHRHHCASHIGGLLRAQKGDHSSHIFRLAESADWKVIVEIFLEGCGILFLDLREVAAFHGNSARRYCRDDYVVPGDLTAD